MCIKPWLRRAPWVVLPVLFACGGPPTAPPAEPYQRVVLYTAHEWPGTFEVADRATRLAGVAVRDTVQVAPQRFRMSLLCADADACRAAIARIAADRTFAVGVDADGRVQIPAKPSRDASR